MVRDNLIDSDKCHVAGHAYPYHALSNKCNVSLRFSIRVSEAHLTAPGHGLYELLKDRIRPFCSGTTFLVFYWWIRR